MSRLRSLIDELDVAGSVTEDDRTPQVETRDPFFTAEVLAALPSRLAFTGITPRQRVVLLGLFHGVAVAMAVGVAWLFAPGLVGGVAQHAHDWAGTLGEVSATWSLAAVVLVGFVALAVTRSHTRST
jgi:hypothetical protein